MTGSIPIYDQFARNRTSLRSVQPIQASPVSPVKQSTSFTTSTPIDGPRQRTTGRARPQSHYFTKDSTYSQQELVNVEESDGTRTTDLKHSRSQSHALFPIKRKEVSNSTSDNLKRAQSVLDSRNLVINANASRDSPSGDPEDVLGHHAAVRGATGYAHTSVADMNNGPAFSKKFVVVGDGGSGKTCLLMRYKERTFPDMYIPTVFENYITHKHHRVSGKTCEVALWDTAGQEEYDRLRPLSYPETDVLLVCFAIDCPQSLDSVKEKWYPEVLHFCPTTPLILVGCKSDLRNNDKAHDQLEGQGLHMLTVQQGLNIANYIGAEAYMECSSKDMVNVDEVFELSMDIAIGTEIGTDWRNTSIVGKMLSKGQLGDASQLGRKAEIPPSRSGVSNQNNINNAAGVGFVGKGSKIAKKKRRACKIL